MASSNVQDGAPLSPCPVVGIGTSAGGVKALQAFFKALPPEAREMDYVVVVHLSPTFESELATILAARTPMPVVQVNEPIPLQPGRVYVIAPDRRLQIAHHEIASVAFDEPHGKRAPIDLFFRSLAEQRGDGFAVILTGAGSDGSVGVKAVKEAGGLILVQDPSEAEYPSMPRSAIATGVADFVLPIRGIAAQLEELLRNKRHLQVQNLAPPEEDILRRTLCHLRARTGHDFSRYKRSTVLRRLARRIQVHRLESLQEYYQLFRENPEEMQALFADLLISVTSFFRDPRAFDALARQVVPLLFEGKGHTGTIRVWVPGCATGEEAYSLAILLAEEASRRDLRPQLQIFASDLDASALATARSGRYLPAISADVSEDRLRRFFEREGDHYRVKREIRDIVLFATHSLLKDPPFARLDLISCRNLLIYLDRELQQHACETFAYALLPGRYLFLGNSENADAPGGLFQVIDREARIFRSTEARAPRPSLPQVTGVPTVQHLPPAHTGPRPESSLLESVHWQALEEATPPSALINEAYRVEHLSENAGRYLVHPRGRVTHDITELVRPELRLQLRAGLHRAFEYGETTLSLPMAVRFNGTAREVALQIRPVQKEQQQQAALVMFIEGAEVTDDKPQGLSMDAALAASNGEALRQLYDELHRTRAKLNASLEEHESSTEELRAANEELQSISEEHRSTAEELETSKEELQSLNEELQTVNNELKSKLEGVSRAHSDLENLISTTDVGTLFLDPALQIKRFTPRILDLFNVTSSDEGRPITDFTHRLNYDRLVADAREVLSNLRSKEQEVQTDSGQWFLMRIRPYRTEQDKIDGVVVTFVDITLRRQAEADLRKSETRLTLAREAADLGVLDYDPVSGKLWWDERTRQLWDVDAEWADLDRFSAGIHRDDEANVRRAMTDALTPRKGSAFNCEFRVRSRSAEAAKWLKINGKAFFDKAGKPIRLVSTVQDVSAAKAAEARQNLLLAELSHRVKNMLCVVQSLARQTLRDHADEAALDAFDARLRALAGAHELLMTSEWTGADLADLIRHQITSSLGDGASQIKARGPAVSLPPQLATAFGLLLHELATNALKHGSLTSPKGTVEVTWELSAATRGPQVLRLHWEERGGPRVQQPESKGFGSYLIDHGLPEASVKRDFKPTGLVCSIDVPLAGTEASA